MGRTPDSQVSPTRLRGAELLRSKDTGDLDSVLTGQAGSDGDGSDSAGGDHRYAGARVGVVR
jgi:hypothetical protein